MIGNIIKANQQLLSKTLFLSEKCFSCNLCRVNTTASSSNVVGELTKVVRRNLFSPSQTFIPNYEAKRYINVNIRCMSVNKYDKLWQAVSSGRGKGRDIKAKQQSKYNEGDYTQFGAQGKQWPGLNAPLDPDKEDKGFEFKKEAQQKRVHERPIVKRRLLPEERGWSGTSWPGKRAGTPEDMDGKAVDGFESMVCELSRVSHTTADGRNRSIRALVIVGNKNGVIGWALAKDTGAAKAIRKARNKAINYLHYVPICDDHTIYHDLRTKIKSTQINFERKVAGHGIRAQRIVKGICTLAGIQDIRCKIVGRTTPTTVVRATFQGLMMQETHQELAERLGKNVVEYRQEQGNRPIVVARPSAEALKRRMMREKEDADAPEDISVAFDPHHGAHRAKSENEVKSAIRV